MWVNFYSSTISGNIVELYCGPLSDTNVSGIPCSEKISLRREVTLVALHCPHYILCIIGRLE